MALKVGFLGYRFMGKAHANALDRLPMFFPEAPAVEREVLVGRDEAALDAAADRFGFARTATDWEDAIDDVDVLYNLGPNYLHAEPSVTALENGVHVFCEKPLAATLADAEEMAAAAERSDATAGIAFNYRRVPAVQYAKDLIEAGDLGDVRHFRGRYVSGGDPPGDGEYGWSWRYSEEHAGAGALGDLGAHTLDLARFLVGDLADLSGRTTTFVDERVDDEGETREVDVDDAYVAHAAFENGAVGTFEASRFATGHTNDNSLQIDGSHGSLKFSLTRLNELEVYRAGQRGFETVLVTDADDPYIDRWWPPGHIIGWEHTFVHENYEFLTAAAGDGRYEPDFGDGLAVQRAIDAVQRSDERGSRVDL
jgi:predicted dehydrogenase